MPARTGCLIAIAAAMALAAPASARQEHPIPATPAVDAVLTTNAEIAASLERIAARSSLWRDAVADVARRNRHALVLTPDQVVVRDAGDRAAVDAFDATSLGEVSPVVRDGAAVDVVMVVINVDLLADVHTRLGTDRDAFEADLDRLVIHEVYGHAIPYLQAGDTSGRCPDPDRGTAAEQSCSVRRENSVRAEAGLGLRRDYAAGGLVALDRLARSAALIHAGAR